MRSLFLRVFVSLWLTMGLVIGVFAIVNAWTFPSEFAVRRRRVSARAMELRATQALECRAAHGEACTEVLDPLDDRDSRLSVYQEGVLLLGEPIAGAAEVESLVRSTGASSGKNEDERELIAIPVARPNGEQYVVVSEQRKPSPIMMFLVPETLHWRLLAIFSVTGLVSIFLARYLSRPIRTLRAATQRLAAGDLSVRVSPQLSRADSETVALGTEMDRMAERIEALLEGQRRLLRDVSHELRSPLARLNLALELVRRKSGPEVEAHLARIERESQRLDEMIGELLTLSRLDAGAGMERPENVELTELVRAVTDDVAFEAEQNGSRLEVTLADGVAIQGNEELLRRTVENILRNAVRFTDKGKSVDVTLGQDEEQIELSIRDHGPGVPESALQAIFEPFYRVEDHRARKQGGAGIGLAIAQRAVGLHGGSLSARNASEGGLLVTMTLPRRRLAAATSP